MKKTVHLDEKVHKELKIISAKTDKTVQRLTNEALLKLIKDLK